MPPIDIIIGLIGIGIFGVAMGALIYLPIADKDSPLSLEKLSNDIRTGCYRLSVASYSSR